MIRLEEWVDIMSLHRQGLGIKTIARRLNISRNAVRRAVRRGGPPVYERPSKPSKLDPFKDYLLQRLSDFPELSCEKLLAEIRNQGYTGGVTILKDFTRPYRTKRKEPVVRFETAPGEQAQVDWSHLGIHELGGQQKALYLFAMVLGYSRCLYAEVVTSMDVETLIACHKRAFTYFGGMTQHILYDNMKAVVIKRGENGDHRFNPTFLDFAGSLGFVPKLCRPYRAKTKGKIERSFGYIKDRFFVGETFAGLEDVNAKLLVWLETEANTRVHATTSEVPLARLRDENLLTIPTRLLVEKASLRPKKEKALFRFEAPVVEVRPLSVYEEVAR